ncbi:hypothetical protein ACJMK2_025819 [Sinanodonta woodiana]|uniref:Mab-21-like HhH/H2TH-like domain-containing protein n=1 Tax=Sinanodonta woodiana TaxID=1069815 RepID=A0ABD3XJ69_SINWO
MADRATREAMSKISLIVMKLLHHIGINKKVRKWRRYMWTQLETLLSLKNTHETGNCGQVFVFGSQIEGSTTAGLKSDLDLVLFADVFAVINIQDAEPGILTFLMVRDEDTNPGYYKLQLVSSFTKEALHAKPFEAVTSTSLAIDRSQRMVLNASSFIWDNATEVHGPASRVLRGALTNDYIMAVRVTTRTQADISWLLRPRQNNWITQNELEYFLEKDLFLVPVGNPLSSERHLEWRLSFTAIERELMWRLNNTQIACCVLMKMINKCFITPAVGKCVSSYHCKTLLFHLIDNTDVEFWKPNNLLTCLNLMLITLSLWVESGFCPNYFITNENMFLGKLDGQLRTRLHGVLVNLIDQDFKYLTQIGCDGLGQALSECCSKHHTQPDTIPALLEGFQRINDCDIHSCVAISFVISSVFSSYTNLLQLGETAALHTLIQWYQTCNIVLHDSLFVLTALICSHFGSHLASSCIATNSMYCRDMEMAHMFLSIGTNSDVTAGTLKLAGFYLKLGCASLAEKVLIAVEQHFRHYISDVSPVEAKFFKENTIHKLMSEDMTTAQIFKRCIAVSVIYLPSEIHCTLPPLGFEMFRSVGADPDLRDPQKDYWYDWAVVDARPYTYFLQYQTYSALGMETHRMVALQNLAWSLTQERIMHTETCLNLLAYCLRQEGLLNLALEHLQLSLQLKPEHNAAKWQIFDMLTQLYNNREVF